MATEDAVPRDQPVFERVEKEDRELPAAAADVAVDKHFQVEEKKVEIPTEKPDKTMNTNSELGTTEEFVAGNLGTRDGESFSESPIPSEVAGEESSSSSQVYEGKDMINEANMEKSKTTLIAEEDLQHQEVEVTIKEAFLPGTQQNADEESKDLPIQVPKENSQDVEMKPHNAKVEDESTNEIENLSDFPKNVSATEKYSQEAENETKEEVESLSEHKGNVSTETECSKEHGEATRSNPQDVEKLIQSDLDENVSMETECVTENSKVIEGTSGETKIPSHTVIPEVVTIEKLEGMSEKTRAVFKETECGSNPIDMTKVNIQDSEILPLSVEAEDEKIDKAGNSDGPKNVSMEEKKEDISDNVAILPGNSIESASIGEPEPQEINHDVKPIEDSKVEELLELKMSDLGKENVSVAPSADVQNASPAEEVSSSSVNASTEEILLKDVGSGKVQELESHSSTMVEKEELDKEDTCYIEPASGIEVSDMVPTITEENQAELEMDKAKKGPESSFNDSAMKQEETLQKPSQEKVLLILAGENREDEVPKCSTQANIEVEESVRPEIFNKEKDLEDLLPQSEPGKVKHVEPSEAASVPLERIDSSHHSEKATSAEEQKSIECFEDDLSQGEDFTSSESKAEESLQQNTSLVGADKEVDSGILTDIAQDTYETGKCPESTTLDELSTMKQSSLELTSTTETEGDKYEKSDVNVVDAEDRAQEKDEVPSGEEEKFAQKSYTDNERELVEDLSVGNGNTEYSKGEADNMNDDEEIRHNDSEEAVAELIKDQIVEEEVHKDTFSKDEERETERVDQEKVVTESSVEPSSAQEDECNHEVKIEAENPEAGYSNNEEIKGGDSEKGAAEIKDDHTITKEAYMEVEEQETQTIDKEKLVPEDIVESPGIEELKLDNEVKTEVESLVAEENESGHGVKTEAENPETDDFHKEAADRIYVDKEIEENDTEEVASKPQEKQIVEKEVHGDKCNNDEEKEKQIIDKEEVPTESLVESSAEGEPDNCVKTEVDDEIKVDDNEIKVDDSEQVPELKDDQILAEEAQKKEIKIIDKEEVPTEYFVESTVAGENRSDHEVKIEVKDPEADNDHKGKEHHLNNDEEIEYSDPEKVAPEPKEDEIVTKEVYQDTFSKDEQKKTKDIVEEKVVAECLVESSVTEKDKTDDEVKTEVKDSEAGNALKGEEDYIYADEEIKSNDQEVAPGSKEDQSVGEKVENDPQESISENIIAEDKIMTQIPSQEKTQEVGAEHEFATFSAEKMKKVDYSEENQKGELDRDLKDLDTEGTAENDEAKDSAEEGDEEMVKHDADAASTDNLTEVLPPIEYQELAKPSGTVPEMSEKSKEKMLDTTESIEISSVERSLKKEERGVLEAGKNAKDYDIEGTIQIVEDVDAARESEAETGKHDGNADAGDTDRLTEGLPSRDQELAENSSAVPEISERSKETMSDTTESRDGNSVEGSLKQKIKNEDTEEITKNAEATNSSQEVEIKMVKHEGNEHVAGNTASTIRLSEGLPSAQYQEFAESSSLGSEVSEKSKEKMSDSRKTMDVVAATGETKEVIFPLNEQNLTAEASKTIGETLEKFEASSLTTEAIQAVEPAEDVEIQKPKVEEEEFTRDNSEKSSENLSADRQVPELKAEDQVYQTEDSENNQTSHIAEKSKDFIIEGTAENDEATDPTQEGKKEMVKHDADAAGTESLAEGLLQIECQELAKTSSTVPEISEKMLDTTESIEISSVEGSLKQEEQGVLEAEEEAKDSDIEGTIQIDKDANFAQEGEAETVKHEGNADATDTDIFSEGLPPRESLVLAENSSEVPEISEKSKEKILDITDSKEIIPIETSLKQEERDVMDQEKETKVLDIKGTKQNDEDTHSSHEGDKETIKHEGNADAEGNDILAEGLPSRDQELAENFSAVPEISQKSKETMLDTTESRDTNSAEGSLKQEEWNVIPAEEERKNVDTEEITKNDEATNSAQEVEMVKHEGNADVAGNIASTVRLSEGLPPTESQEIAESSSTETMDVAATGETKEVIFPLNEQNLTAEASKTIDETLDKFEGSSLTREVVQAAEPAEDVEIQKPKVEEEEFTRDSSGKSSENLSTDKQLPESKAEDQVYQTEDSENNPTSSIAEKAANLEADDFNKEVADQTNVDEEIKENDPEEVALKPQEDQIVAKEVHEDKCKKDEEKENQIIDKEEVPTECLEESSVEGKPDSGVKTEATIPEAADGHKEDMVYSNDDNEIEVNDSEGVLELKDDEILAEEVQKDTFRKDEEKETKTIDKEEVPEEIKCSDPENVAPEPKEQLVAKEVYQDTFSKDEEKEAQKIVEVKAVAACLVESSVTGKDKTDNEIKKEEKDSEAGDALNGEADYIYADEEIKSIDQEVAPGSKEDQTEGENVENQKTESGSQESISENIIAEDKIIIQIPSQEKTEEVGAEQEFATFSAEEMKKEDYRKENQREELDRESKDLDTEGSAKNDEAPDSAQEGEKEMVKHDADAAGSDSLAELLPPREYQELATSSTVPDISEKSKEEMLNTTESLEISLVEGSLKQEEQGVTEAEKEIDEDANAAQEGEADTVKHERNAEATGPDAFAEGLLPKESPALAENSSAVPETSEKNKEKNLETMESKEIRPSETSLKQEERDVTDPEKETKVSDTESATQNDEVTHSAQEGDKETIKHDGHADAGGTDGLAEGFPSRDQELAENFSAEPEIAERIMETVSDTVESRDRNSVEGSLKQGDSDVIQLQEKTKSVDVEDITQNDEAMDSAREGEMEMVKHEGSEDVASNTASTVGLSEGLPPTEDQEFAESASAVSEDSQKSKEKNDYVTSTTGGTPFPETLQQNAQDPTIFPFDEQNLTVEVSKTIDETLEKSEVCSLTTEAVQAAEPAEDVEIPKHKVEEEEFTGDNIGKSSENLSTDKQVPESKAEDQVYQTEDSENNQTSSIEEKNSGLIQSQEEYPSASELMAEECHDKSKPEESSRSIENESTDSIKEDVEGQASPYRQTKKEEQELDVEAKEQTHEEQYSDDKEFRASSSEDAEQELVVAERAHGPELVNQDIIPTNVAVEVNDTQSQPIQDQVEAASNEIAKTDTSENEAGNIQEEKGSSNTQEAADEQIERNDELANVNALAYEVSEEGIRNDEPVIETDNFPDVVKSNSIVRQESDTRRLEEVHVDDSFEKISAQLLQEHPTLPEDTAKGSCSSIAESSDLNAAAVEAMIVGELQTVEENGSDKVEEYSSNPIEEQHDTKCKNLEVVEANLASNQGHAAPIEEIISDMLPEESKQISSTIENREDHSTTINEFIMNDNSNTAITTLEEEVLQKEGKTTVIEHTESGSFSVARSSDQDANEAAEKAITQNASIDNSNTASGTTLEEEVLQKEGQNSSESDSKDNSNEAIKQGGTAASELETKEYISETESSHPSQCERSTEIGLTEKLKDEESLYSVNINDGENTAISSLSHELDNESEEFNELVPEKTPAAVPKVECSEEIYKTEEIGMSESEEKLQEATTERRDEEVLIDESNKIKETTSKGLSSEEVETTETPVSMISHLVPDSKAEDVPIEEIFPEAEARAEQDQDQFNDTLADTISDLKIQGNPVTDTGSKISTEDEKLQLPQQGPVDKFFQPETELLEPVDALKADEGAKVAETSNGSPDSKDILQLQKKTDVQNFLAVGENQDLSEVKPEEGSLGEEKETPGEPILGSMPREISATSLSDLLSQASKKEISKVSNDSTAETEPDVQKEEIKDVKTEMPEHEELRTDEEREGDDHDSPVTVEAPSDIDMKAAHKKSHHNILSGVGSKVKHSIAKVKKAITGKSSQCSHPKQSPPK